MTTLSIRSYAWAGLTAALVLLASPAHAQYKPRPLNDPATGEQYHIEASAAWWKPTTEMTVASEGFGIQGTPIDFKNDLGLQDKWMPAFSLVLRPAKSHKFRGQLIPIKYSNSAKLPRTIVFNGQRYTFDSTVNWALDWKAYRLNYEFDFITKNRGYGGFIIEAKYTDVQVQLDSTVGSVRINEFAHAKFPLPALGGIARVYVVPNISITGEVTGFKLPDSIDSRYGGHYVDVDVYGTINFNNYVGVQGGYRSLDLGYLVKTDTGSFTLRGIYVGAVVRY
jgi:hypothetical protein